MTLAELKLTPAYAALERAAEALRDHSKICVRCYPPHSTLQDPRGPCDEGKALLADATAKKRALRSA